MVHSKDTPAWQPGGLASHPAANPRIQWGPFIDWGWIQMASNLETSCTFRESQHVLVITFIFCIIYIHAAPKIVEIKYIYN